MVKGIRSATDALRLLTVYYWVNLDLVHTTSEKFENEVLFRQLGLPSTLIRHENAALFLRLGLPSTLIRQENPALFLRLDLPSKLIRHETGAFRNALQIGGI